MKQKNLSFSSFLFSSLSLLLFLSFSACSGDYTDGVKTLLPVQEFHDLLKKTPNAQVIDVRTAEEYAGGHLAASVNIDYNSPDFLKLISELPKDKPAFVYCLSGGRSSAAAKELRRHGIELVYEMEGGMMKWRESGLPEQAAAAATSGGMSIDEYQAHIPPGKTVLVDFYAEWCEPCKRMKPWLDELSLKDADKLTVVRIDADKNRALCNSLEISALPVLKLYVDGKLEWTNLGYLSRDEARKKIGLDHE